MTTISRIALVCALTAALAVLVEYTRVSAQIPPNTAVLNGKWFDGKTFKARTVYSVNGLFTFRKPGRVDKTLDLAGTWIVPPFADAHNHNIGTGVDEWDREAILRFLQDGVFYVKIMGNLPLTDDGKSELSLNGPDRLDVVFGQGTITSSGGMPIGLIENVLLRQGYFPGFTKERLKDHRYFTIDSEAELEQKWPAILRNRPDFIKTFLWYSDEYEKRKNDPAYFGQRGLSPDVLAKIIAKAHARGLRVAAHVTNAADFHNAVVAGVDEIAHLPLLATTPITAEDAKLAAKRGVVVITTAAIVPRLPRMGPFEIDSAEVLKTQKMNLELLRDSGSLLAIGSDNVSDSSVAEVEYLQGLGVFDNLSLLKMWTETTPRSIYPKRKLGSLREGYEASFLALEGNPLEDLQNVRRVSTDSSRGL
jgi:imidazolonepropionase-like amidohydrolase